MKSALFALALLAACVSGQEVDVDSGVAVSSADRAVDISSQVVKYVTEFRFENAAKAPINYVLYALSANEDKHLSFIAATADNKNQALKVSRATLKGGKSDVVVYKIELLSMVAVGGKTTVKVEAILAQYLNPYPSHITQAEQQFVVYDGNAHILSPYAIKKETTNIALYPGQVESFTKVEPSKQDAGKITYGPYENTPALTTKEIRIHYENNSPFVVATHLERIIEVSHWGNIAVEEKLELVHKGAILKGSFSRLDFQMDRRGNKQPAVKSYKTLLPAAAKDVYYRDEIGNISTSNLRQTEEAVELEIRPRFPLFGGWKTNYVIGYNVPSYEYLYSSGSQFALKMRFLDHVFDNAVVEEVTVKVILPEGAKNIKLDPPYKVKRSPDELHYTYLDTTGRPVIIAHKTNLVEAHIQEFTLHYEFDRTGLWREPFIAIVAFYILFVAVIIWVRFDFTIATDASSESRLKVQSLVEQLSEAHNQRMAVYEQYTEVINKFKASKDNTALANGKKKVENDLKNVTTQIGDFQTDVKASSPEVSEKIGELQRLDKLVKEQLATYQQQVERLVGGKIQKAQFTESEKTFTQKMDELKGKMDNIVYGL